MTIWTLDPVTLTLTCDRDRLFEQHEIGSQEFPGCPQCGATIAVDWINVSGVTDAMRGKRGYMAGRWHCPRACNQRPDSVLHMMGYRRLHGDTWE